MRKLKIFGAAAVTLAAIAVLVSSLMPARQPKNTTDVLGGAGCSINFKLSADRTSAPADGSTQISVEIYTYYGTDEEYPGDPATGPLKYDISSSGSNNTLSDTTLTNDGDSRVSFTLKSTKAESKTISVNQYNSGAPACDQSKNLSVSFTAPPSSTSTKPKTGTSTTTPNAPTPPAAPTLATDVKIGDQVVATTAPISLLSNQGLTLSGTTVAKGVVKLFIFSEPREESTTADDQGNWSYTISDLEPGDHRVEAAVTDPATNLTSERKELLKFAVTAPPVTETPTIAATKKNPWLIPAIAVSAIALGASGYFGWRWWSKRGKNQVPPQSPEPPQSVTPVI